MPTLNCQLDAIQTDLLCSSKGGLLSVFWIDRSLVDWASMLDVSANYDDATYTLSNFVYTGAARFTELSFQAKNGRLDALYTSDNDYYEVSLLNLLFEGKSPIRSVSLANAISCCGIAAVVFDNNGFGRMIGKEYISGGWLDPLTNVKITRHLDTHGAFGAADDRARDEFDLTGEHRIAPAYVDLTLGAFRAAHT